MEITFDFFQWPQNSKQGKPRILVFIVCLFYNQFVSFIYVWTYFEKYLSLLMQIKILQLLHRENGRVLIKVVATIWYHWSFHKKQSVMNLMLQKYFLFRNRVVKNYLITQSNSTLIVLDKVEAINLYEIIWTKCCEPWLWSNKSLLW